MRIYYHKNVIFFILAFILPATNGFCMPGLLSSAAKINAAQASPHGNQITDADACGDYQQKQKSAASMTMPIQHNSLLPCCVGGSHAKATALSESAEITKLISVIFFPENHLVKNSPKNAIYLPQIKSPPKPQAIKSIVLLL